MVVAKVRIIKMIASDICQNGTSVMAIRVIIKMGEKNGMIELTTERTLSGLLHVWNMMKYAINIGAPTGNMSCCVSVSESAAEPMAANSELYSKYPRIKKMIK